MGYNILDLSSFPSDKKVVGYNETLLDYMLCTFRLQFFFRPNPCFLCQILVFIRQYPLVPFQIVFFLLWYSPMGKYP